MTNRYDVAIIGGGIVGLAHAWMAARQSLRVLLLERSTVAHGASVRNFGMIWPVGQPAGEAYEIALRSREFWLELGSLGAVDVHPCGSIHLAHRADEMAVLEEFCSRRSHDAELIGVDQIVKQTPLANPDGLLGGMLSPTELRVDPRSASSQIAGWLSTSLDVDCRFETSVVRVDDGQIHASDGRVWSADRIVVCGGSDLRTLYPEVLAKSGLVLCKLQMFKADHDAKSSRSPHLASGLTLRHYAAFDSCTAQAELKSRIAAETPELDRYGIHVMASPQACGDVILGDSHEYGDEITPFDKSEIDDLMLRELRKVIRLQDWTITERWHGIYAKYPPGPVFEFETDDGVNIFTGTGGAGMTMAFGLAARAWERWTGAIR